MPLLERLRFLTIVSGNLDEFFEVRVAELKQRQSDIAVQELQAIYERASDLIRQQYILLNNDLLPAMAKQGIVFHLSHSWNKAQKNWAQKYFRKLIAPLLVPLGIDAHQPFPKVLNKNLNFIAELDGVDVFGRKLGYAIVQVPRSLPRVIAIPEPVSQHRHGLMMLSSIIQGFIAELFEGFTVKAVYQFRLTRNSDLFVDDENIEDLKEVLQGELLERHFGQEVRLEVSSNCSDGVMAFLASSFGLQQHDCYRVDGPVNLMRLSQTIDLVHRPDLVFPIYKPRIIKTLRRHNIFSALKRNALLLHHPYDSFEPVADFLRSAWLDPKVVAIKQTIYRTGSDSELMSNLVDAAKTGKEVTVVVELMARFDEETNINWAKKLQAAGANVVYGVVGHKTHAKMALIVRREAGKLIRYAHLGTGNYHAKTARLYEDFGLLTADAEITADVDAIFKRLTGLGFAVKLSKLLQAPLNLQTHLLSAIAREVGFAAKGRKALVMFKCNALLSTAVVEALYAASQAGVRVELIVRGVCALRPGIRGLSDNIHVRSVIGRFLEHSRVYYFHQGGKKAVYLSSADLMDRNMLRRVEIAFPVLDAKLKARVIREAFEVHLQDSQSSWQMSSKGSDARDGYHRELDNPGSSLSQQRLMIPEKHS